jgi:hypothetical protein
VAVWGEEAVRVGVSVSGEVEVRGTLSFSVILGISVALSSTFVGFGFCSAASALGSPRSACFWDVRAFFCWRYLPISSRAFVRPTLHASALCLA